MNFTFNPYSIILLACSFATLILVNVIYKKGGKAVQWVCLMMISNTIWSIGYGLELASVSLNQIKFLIGIQYLGITTLPLSWLFFCLHFYGKENWYKKPFNLFLILFIPIVTILLVWTNDFHHFHYKNITLDNKGPFPMANLEAGFWYPIFIIYFYFILIFGGLLIISKFRASDKVYRRQNYSIIIAVSIPWIVNIAYLLGFKPFGHIDGTPFTFIITFLIILTGVYRFKLFDIIPIAREKILELMQDGFMILDQKNRIIDYNKSIYHYINNGDRKSLIGIHINDIFPNQSELLTTIINHKEKKIEVKVNVGQQTVYLQVDILFLNNNKLNNDFTIIKLQDLTELKKEAIEKRDQAIELDKLNQLKDRIFSIISHDLRGPLVNLSEILKMTANDQITFEEFKNLSPALTKDIIYTTELLENILHWSRSQLNGFGINKEFFNLNQLLKNETDYYLPSATHKKIKIETDFLNNLTVFADNLMIQIVIRNLINNAIKFCEENCVIKISSKYQTDTTVNVYIEDNGKGINKDLLKKLINQEHISTRGTLNEKGTGLGLIVCKEFMNKNGGDLFLESEEGKGTKFYITIPTKNKEGAIN